MIWLVHPSSLLFLITCQPSVVSCGNKTTDGSWVFWVNGGHEGTPGLCCRDTHLCVLVSLSKEWQWCSDMQGFTIKLQNKWHNRYIEIAVRYSYLVFKKYGLQMLRCIKKQASFAQTETHVRSGFNFSSKNEKCVVKYESCTCFFKKKSSEDFMTFKS